MKYFAIGKEKIYKFSCKLYNLLILLIINHPLVIIFITIIIGSITSFLGIWFSPLIDFKSPFSVKFKFFLSNIISFTVLCLLKGFITRGTPIASNRLAKAKLNKMLDKKEVYLVNDMIKSFTNSDNINSKDIYKRFNSLSDNYASVSNIFNEDENSDYEIIEKILNQIKPDIKNSNSMKFKREAGFTKIKLNKRFKKKVVNLNIQEPYIECNPVLNDECSQIIIESKDPVSNSIMSFESILIQCQFIEQFLKPHFRSILSNLSSSHEILFESLPGSIAKFSRKKTCNELEKENIENFTLIFKYCAPIYHNLMELDLMKHSLMDEANELQLSQICRDKNLFDTFKYLIEKDFVNKNPTLKLNLNSAQLQQQLLLLNNQNSDDLKPPEVKYSNIYMSISKNDSKFLVPFYHEYLEPNFLYKPLVFSENINSYNKNFHIIGVNFDIKNNLFFIYLRPNLNWMITISIFILSILAVYTRNVSLTISMLICSSISLMQSYAIFKLVFKIELISFLNIIHPLFIVAFALDSLIIFNDVWNEAKDHYKIILTPNNNQKMTQTLYRRIEAKSRITNMTSEATNEYNSNSTEKQEYSRINLMFYLEKCVNYLFANTIQSIILKNMLMFICFLINFNSSIIIIKLFGVFISICILMNCMLIYTIIPSILVAQLKYSNYLSCSKFECLAIVKSFFCPTIIVNIRLFLNNIINQIRYFYNRIFEKWLPDLIISFRYIFITILISFSILSFVIIFYKPSLTLPTTSSLQVFPSSNPIEYYDRYLSKMSISNGIFLNQIDKKPFLQVSYLFGLSSKDTESSISMNNLGEIDFDYDNFDFYDEKSQLWLYQFCNSLKSQNSIENSQNVLSLNKELVLDNENGLSDNANLDLQQTIFERKKINMIRYTSNNLDDRLNQLDVSLSTNETFVDYDYSHNKICLFDLLKKFLGRKCVTKSIEEDEDNFIDSVCCDQTFPFDPKVLEICLKNSEFLNVYISVNQKFLYEKLYYNKTNGVINVVEYQQSLSTNWTPDYSAMLNTYKMIEEFFKKHLKYVIVDLTTKLDSKFRKSFASKAFFVSEFDFLDFQISLSNKTLESFIIASSVSMILVLFVTRNILLTIIIVFSALMNNATTFSILTLLGWQLNAIETICILLSIGFSFSFMIHFATTYGKITKSNFNCDLIDEPTTMFFKRENYIKLVIKHAGSTIFITCAVYMFFGLLILLSFFNLFSLQSFGFFLFLISFLNIFYGFFLFIPILSIIGPINNICQINFNQNNENNELSHQKNNQNELQNNEENERNIINDHKSLNTSCFTKNSNESNKHKFGTINTENCSMVLSNI